MNDTYSFQAYCATLFAICYLTTIAVVAAWAGKSIEAVGVAAAVTGLIGLIKFPSRSSVTVDNPPSNPVPVEPS